MLSKLYSSKAALKEGKKDLFDKKKPLLFHHERRGNCSYNKLQLMSVPLFFKLRYSHFTTLCQFLKEGSGSATCIYIFLPFRISFVVDCAQLPSCLRLCDPMDFSLPGSSARGDSPGKNTGKGCHALLQGIFPTQGSNPSILQCRWIPSRLSHQGSFLKGAQTEAQNSTLSPLGSHKHQHGVGI